MLRRSLKHYNEIKAASTQSRASSEYASCEENVPADSVGWSEAPGDRLEQLLQLTPTSRLENVSRGVLTTRNANLPGQRLYLTVRDTCSQLTAFLLSA